MPPSPGHRSPRQRAGFARDVAFAAALAWATGATIAVQPLASRAAELPIFDAHIHYSHDAWEVVPTPDVIRLMREAGLKRALVSSSSDEGTQRLYQAAPDLVIPSLRPYRRRGEISTWVRDETVTAHVEERLRRYRYAAIGEFHLYGADADLPVPRRLVELAKQYGLILHAHSDADAVERIFRQDPQARVLWAHSGFDRPQQVRDMLRRHGGLYADLAYRSDMGSDGRVDPDWLEVFREFPDRFMVGTDTFTPERLHFIPEHARYSRGWLAALPPDLAERIAWKNGEAFVGPVWEASRKKAGEPAARGDCDGLRRHASPVPLMESEGLLVTYAIRPQPIRPGEPFALDLVACGRTPDDVVRDLRVDAWMPAHRHGMNYAPKVSAQGGGRYAAEGLVFHMPGRWQIVVDARVGETSERATVDVVLR